MRRWVAGWVAFSGVFGVALSATAQGFPKAAARLEYERRPAAASCPDEEAFRQEVAILRHARDDFLPADPYDEQTVVVRITLDRAGGRYRGTLTHVPPAGTPAEAPKVEVNSECEDLLRDLAFLATFFLLNELKAAIDERTKQLEALEIEAAAAAQAETERKAKEDSLAALEEMESDIKKKIAAAKVALSKK